MDTLDLRPFKTLVALRCGLNFNEFTEAHLATAVKKRIRDTGALTPAAYLSTLASDETEFHEFVVLLTINETYFFREPSQLALLTETLLPQLMATRPPNVPLRIFSAGCSSGEEPYSIAIALREKFGAAASHLATIVAADIDHQALARARQAEYGAYSFRGVPAAIRDRYFTAHGKNSYHLCADVRELVEFRQCNLLAPQYPAGLSGFDIVFFRNVSIYFDTPTRKAILQALSRTMNDTGYLVLGASETLANDLGVFQLLEQGGGFYFAKGTRPLPVSKPRPAAGMPRPAPAATVRPPLPAQTPSSRADWKGAMESVRQLMRDKRYQDALNHIAPQAVGTTDPRFRLLESHIRLQMRQFDRAAEIAAQVHGQDNWSAEAHMLQGLAAKWQNDTQGAIRWFKLLVYSRPDCWPAHYYLANLQQDIDPANARRGFATALRQLNATPDPDGGLQLPLDLPVADIRFLCERRSQAKVEPTPQERTTRRGS